MTPTASLALTGLVLGAHLAFAPPAAAPADWPQWGGPHRDFRVDAELAPAWPPEGPKIAWRRPLGDGYSGIAVANGTLYTLYREQVDEVAIALDAATGDTIWSHRYEAPIPPYMIDDRGVGPRATPLVTADRVFVVGVRGTLQALERASGKPIWRRELVAELGGSEDVQGYASSPLAWRDLVIVPAGGDGHAMVAFRQATGEVAWKSGNFENALTSPFLVELAGDLQVVALLSGAVAGFAPSSGDLLWQHPHPSPRGDRNISTPVFDGIDRLFVSSLDGGSRVLRLRAERGSISAKELWRSDRLRVQFTNAVWRGDVIYASNGSTGPIPLTAVSASSGEILWRERAFGRAHLIDAGERILLLDENGTLAVVELGPAGIEVRARWKLPQDELMWTAPSVAGNRVYVRTRTQLLALELPSP